MVALIDKKCRVCLTEQDITVKISDYAETVNECLPISIDKNDGFGDKICHRCLFDITLCGELVVKYKNFKGIPVENKCYLCLKENVNLPVHGSLFRTIRKVESSLTIKNILQNNGIVGCAQWNSIKKKLRSRKVCTDCYFLVDTVANLYEKIKESDNAIKKIIEETDNWLYGEDPEEAEDNRKFIEAKYLNPSGSRRLSNRDIKEEKDSDDEGDEDEEEYSDGSDESSGLSEIGESSEVDNEIKTHDILKRIKKEDEEEEVEIDQLAGDVIDAKIKQEVHEEEVSTSTGRNKRGRKKKTIKEEPVSFDEEGFSENDDNENLEVSTSGGRKKTGLKRKQPMKEEPIDSDNVDSEDNSAVDENLEVTTSIRKERRGRKRKQPIKEELFDSDCSEDPLDHDSDDENSSEEFLSTIKNEVNSEDEKVSGEESDVGSNAMISDEDESVRTKTVAPQEGKMGRKGKQSVSISKVQECSWCKKPLNHYSNKSHLCLICIEKYRQAMAGIHAGRSCRVFLTDLKYSNQDSNTTEKQTNKSNKKRKHIYSGESDSEPPLKNKKQSQIAVQSLAKERDSILSATSVEISVGKKLTPSNKNIREKHSKISIIESNNSILNNCIEQSKDASVIKKRNRTSSGSSSASSEKVNILRKQEKNSINVNKNSESIFTEGKCYFRDHKLKCLQGWQIRLKRISLPLSTKNNSAGKIMASLYEESEKVRCVEMRGNNVKPAPKSKTRSLIAGNKYNCDFTDVSSNVLGNITSESYKFSPKPETNVISTKDINNSSDEDSDKESSKQFPSDHSDVESNKSIHAIVNRAGPKSKTNVKNSKLNESQVNEKGCGGKPETKSKISGVYLEEKKINSIDEEILIENGNKTLQETQEVKRHGGKPGPKSKTIDLSSNEKLVHAIDKDNLVENNNETQVKRKGHGKKPGPKSKTQVDSGQLHVESDLITPVTDYQSRPKSETNSLSMNEKQIISSNEDDNDKSNETMVKLQKSVRKPGPKSKTPVGSDFCDDDSNKSVLVESHKADPQSQTKEPEKQKIYLSNHNDEDILSNVEENEPLSKTCDACNTESETVDDTFKDESTGLESPSKITENATANGDSESENELLLETTPIKVNNVTKEEEDVLLNDKEHFICKDSAPVSLNENGKDGLEEEISAVEEENLIGNCETFTSDSDSIKVTEKREVSEILKDIDIVNQGEEVRILSQEVSPSEKIISADQHRRISDDNAELSEGEKVFGKVSEGCVTEDCRNIVETEDNESSLKDDQSINECEQENVDANLEQDVGN